MAEAADVGRAYFQAVADRDVDAMAACWEPGCVDEQWTLSVAHTDADLQRYVDAFEAFARDVTA